MIWICSSEKFLPKEKIERFSIIMFARFEMFKYLDEFDTVTWIDTDVIIQKKLEKLLEEADSTGFALVREDPKNKSSENVDYMRTCFIKPISHSGYDIGAYLYCSAIIVLTRKMNIKEDYTNWCYNKTIEWADNLNLPDQAVINALIQEFDIAVSCLNGKQYGCFPSNTQDCRDSVIVHNDLSILG
jgi:lipopolysaccharide biosynthesis glycosyltransferase